MAGFLVWVQGQLGMEVPPDVASAAKECYGNIDMLDAHTALLCSTLAGLSKQQAEGIIWNGKDATSRKLADWWERHQQADKDRVAKEKATERKAKLRKQALAKLTPEEIEAMEAGR